MKSPFYFNQLKVFALLLTFSVIITGCGISQKQSHHNLVESSDIDLFWKAFDIVSQESDSAKQVELLTSHYLHQGTEGLEKMIEARGYTAEEYVYLINQYPNFWKSIRANTLKSDSLAQELAAGIEKLRVLYPSLKPATIYFVIGAMRSNGTTQDDAILIGAELAMADTLTDISEFSGRTKDWLEGFFGTNPLEALPMLNQHEYVHTQQNAIPGELLYQCLYEGVAEYVSVLAADRPSESPAIDFGKNHPEVRQKFEREMFYELTYEWLWSIEPNEFDTRDLGYYIGYSIAELHYKNAENKAEAIKELIELDYSNTEKVDALINRTGFFSRTIAELRSEGFTNRPTVLEIKELSDTSAKLPASTRFLEIRFSEPVEMITYGFNYSDEGRSAFPEMIDGKSSEDQRSFILEVDLTPNSSYSFWINQGFQNIDGSPIVPYLIEFKTNAI